MLSKRYIPTHLENLNNEENLAKHYKKLEAIQKEDRKKKNVDKEVTEKAKFFESREKTIKFHINERTNAIEKDNELLLGRLVEISRKKPKVLAQIKSETNLPRTLNGPSRRREKNRIAAENEAFARRLLSQQPSFNPKKLEVDYEKHHQRVRNMAKLTSTSPRKLRLPPIKPVESETKKSQKLTKKDLKKKDNENEVNEAKQVKTEGNEASDTEPIQKNEKAKSGEIENVKVDNREAEEREAKEKEAREKEAKEKEAREKEAQEKEAREKEAREKEAKEKETEEKIEEEPKIEENKEAPVSSVADNKSQVLADSQQPKVENNEEQAKDASKNAIKEDNQVENKPVEEIETNKEEKHEQ